MTATSDTVGGGEVMCIKTDFYGGVLLKQSSITSETAGIETGTAPLASISDFARF